MPMETCTLVMPSTQGKRVQYVPGWDCHGLPIELKALQQAALSNHGKDGADPSASALKVRRLARKLAEKQLEAQKVEFKSWGVIGDWDHAYKTMDREYVARELEIFRDLVEQSNYSSNEYFRS
jgi:isoleucyl-tRNA synthetase